MQVNKEAEHSQLLYLTCKIMNAIFVLVLVCKKLLTLLPQILII